MLTLLQIAATNSGKRVRNNDKLWTKCKKQLPNDTVGQTKSGRFWREVYTCRKGSIHYKFPIFTAVSLRED